MRGRKLSGDGSSQRWQRRKVTQTCHVEQQLQERMLQQRQAYSLQLSTKMRMLLSLQLGEGFPQPKKHFQLLRSEFPLIDVESTSTGDVA